MFKWLKKLISKIVSVLAKLGVFAALLLTIAAFAFPALLPFGLTAIQAYWVAGGLFASSFIIDKEAAIAAVDKVGSIASDAVDAVGSVAGDVAGSIGGAAGNVAGGLASGLLTSPLGLTVLAIGAFLLLKSMNKQPHQQ